MTTTRRGPRPGLAAARRMIEESPELRELFAQFARDAATPPHNIADAFVVAMSQAFNLGKRAGETRASERIGGVLRSISLEAATSGNA